MLHRTYALGGWRAPANLVYKRLDTHAYGARRFLADHPNPPKQTGKQPEEAQTPATNTDAPIEPSFTKSTSETAAENDKRPLPYLSHPLGVPARPTADTPTWIERHPEWYDRNARVEKRRRIVQEATRGYFHDFHGMRSHGGKTWRSPATMIRHDVRVYSYTHPEIALFP